MEVSLKALLGFLSGMFDALSSAPDGDLARATKAAMVVLRAGIVLSALATVFPVVSDHLAIVILQALGITLVEQTPVMGESCLKLGTLIAAGPARYLIDYFWLVGATLLTFQPLKGGEQARAFVVFQVSMIFAAVLPLLETSSSSALIYRFLFTGVVVLWMSHLAGNQICQAIFPWTPAYGWSTWKQVWDFKLGDMALTMWASELLAFGYACFTIRNALGLALAWAFVGAGAVAMSHLGWKTRKSGLRLGEAFGGLNRDFALGAAFQLVWLAGQLIVHA
jgi:hypothetical protein